jgi:hypothetical protein
MANIICLCGEYLSNSSFPNCIEGWIYAEWDPITGEIGVPEAARAVWECNKCGRLLIAFPDQRDNRVKVYKPEDGIPGNLFKVSA